jgi:hypothetical protein
MRFEVSIPLTLDRWAHSVHFGLLRYIMSDTWGASLAVGTFLLFINDIFFFIYGNRPTSAELLPKTGSMGAQPDDGENFFADGRRWLYW